MGMQIIRPLFVISLALLVTACLPKEPPPPPPPPDCDDVISAVDDAYSGMGATLMGIANQMQASVDQYEAALGGEHDAGMYADTFAELDSLSTDMASEQVAAYQAAVDAANAAVAAGTCTDQAELQAIFDLINMHAQYFNTQAAVYFVDASHRLTELAEEYCDGPYTDNCEPEDGPETPGANAVMDADQTIGDCTTGACIPN